MRTPSHDFDGWPGPVRAPQHAAAPFGASSPVRTRAHRALRLFATAGLWAAGLCLVVGLIALVVSQARPGRLAPAAVTTPTRADPGKLVAGRRHSLQAVPPASHRPAGRQPARAARVLAVFAGHGDKTTRTFRTAAAGRWQIRWAYTCAAPGRAGQFIVADARRGAAGPSISQAGLAGQGTLSLSPSGWPHHLIVISTCSWTMKVTQQR